MDSRPLVCSAHAYHYPIPLTVELHHVIPQAWQNFILGAEKLFDKRTVPLCPTCHRNVHTWIVAAMKQTSPTPRTAEGKIAQLALDRWVEAGYSLEALRAKKLWGQA